MPIISSACVTGFHHARSALEETNLTDRPEPSQWESKEDFWPTTRLLILGGLILGSLLTLWFIWSDSKTDDPIAKLACAVLGGIGIAFLVPFWGLFRGGLSLWVVLSIIAAVLFSVMQWNAETCRISGTYQVHFYDHWYLMLFSLPGLATLIKRNHGNNPKGKGFA